MKKRIEEYQLEWNPEKRGKFRLRLQQSQDWTDWIILQSSDFTALIIMLKEEPCFFDEETQTLSSNRFLHNQEKGPNLSLETLKDGLKVDSIELDILNFPKEEETPNKGDDFSAEKDSLATDNNFDMLSDNGPQAFPKIVQWRVAKSLEVLRSQINKNAPNRSKKSDGTIGDTNHQNRNSDHNPWVLDGGVGVVTALDITHDPTNGCDANEIAQTIRVSRDKRVKYIIWNRQIASASPKDGHPAWAWRTYSGANPHNHHIHISVKSDKPNYDSTAFWQVLSQVPVS